MISRVLEKLRECCDNSKSHIVIYDGADTGDLPLLVCENCFNESSFQKHILAKYQITQKTIVEEVLRKHLQN